MKFNFHDDKRLMQTAGSTGGNSISQNTAATLDRLKKDAETARGRAAQEAARQALTNFIIQNKLLDASADAKAQLITLAQGVAGTRAQNTQAVSLEGARSGIQLQTQRGGILMGMQQTAAQTIFSVQMIGPQLQAMVYGLAEAAGNFFNNPDWKKWGQDGLQSIRYPTMDTVGVSGVSTAISDTAGRAMVDNAATDATHSLQTVSREQVLEVAGTLLQDLRGGHSTTAPVTGITRNANAEAISHLVTEGAITPRQSIALTNGFKTADANNNGVVEANEQGRYKNIVDDLLQSSVNAVNARKAVSVERALGITPPGPAPALTH